MKPSTSTVASVGIGIPVATIISWAVSQFAGIEVPGTVEAAFGVVIGALAGYFFVGGKAIDTQDDAPPQAGFIRPLMLAALLAAAVPVFASLPGCAGTQHAYRSAGTLDEQAYVVTEHYAALVKEAADIAQAPGTPRGVIEALQGADLIANPIVLAVRPLAERYRAARTAQTEVELQAAVNEAMVAVSSFISIIKTARART